MVVLAVVRHIADSEIKAEPGYNKEEKKKELEGEIESLIQKIKDTPPPANQWGYDPRRTLKRELRQKEGSLEKLKQDFYTYYCDNIPAPQTRKVRCEQIKIKFAYLLTNQWKLVEDLEPYSKYEEVKESKIFTMPECLESEAMKIAESKLTTGSSG